MPENLIIVPPKESQPAGQRVSIPESNSEAGFSSLGSGRKDILIIPPSEPQSSLFQRRYEKSRRNYGRTSQKDLIRVPSAVRQDTVLQGLDERDENIASSDKDGKRQSVEQSLQSMRVEKSKFNYRRIKNKVVAGLAALTIVGGPTLLGVEIHKTLNNDETNLENSQASQSNVEQIVENKHDLPPLPDFQPPDPNQRALVVLMHDRKDGVPFVEQDLKNNLQQVQDFYARESNGKVHFSFNVLPWRAVDKNIDTNNRDQIVSLGGNIMQENGIGHPEQYQTIIYVAGEPDDYAAGEAGSSPEYGNKEIRIYATADPLVYEHELGHTLGLGHGEKDKTNAGKETEDQEYGDNSPMGVIDNVEDKFTAVQKFEAGFIGKENVQSVTHDGDFTLSEFDAYSPNNKMILRLNKPDTNERYYVELRGNHAPSIRVYAWDEKRGYNTKAIETPNGELDWTNFYDMDNGIRISIDPTTYNETTHTAQISVNFDK